MVTGVPMTTQRHDGASFATAENKLNEAMLADLVQNVFAQKKFRFHVTDPATGKRETREIGG